MVWRAVEEGDQAGLLGRFEPQSSLQLNCASHLLPVATFAPFSASSAQE